MTQARIADYLEVSRATVSRVLTLAGLTKPSDLEPAKTVVRYEHEQPGAEGAGSEVLFAAIDGHARVAFSRRYPNESKHSTTDFLCHAHACFMSLGMQLKAILTDSGPAFRSSPFNQAVLHFRLRLRFTRSYRPQTSCKTE